jgi:hypothetical protein
MLVNKAPARAEYCIDRAGRFAPLALRLFWRDFGALFARFGQAYSYRLFAAGYFAAFTALTGSESALLFLVQCFFHALARGLAVSWHRVSPMSA